VRRSVAIAAFACASIASLPFLGCGGFLGFGDDGDGDGNDGTEVPRPDGGPSTADGSASGAEGGVEIDGAGGDGAADICTKHTLVFTNSDSLDGVLAGTGWAKTSTAAVTMNLIEGRLVITANPSNGTEQGFVYFIGKKSFTRLTCRYAVALSTFGHDGARFGQLGLEGAPWQEYRPYVETVSSQLHAGLTATTFDSTGGSAPSLGFDVPGIAPNQPFPTVLDFVARSKPKYTATLNGAAIAPITPTPAVFEGWRAMIGLEIPPSSDVSSLTATYGDIECESCVAP
jgi:hypothetical protein